jgi:hypothetical protein
LRRVGFFDLATLRTLREFERVDVGFLVGITPEETNEPLTYPAVDALC